MSQTLLNLSELQLLINWERETYQQAIKNDQKFEDVKAIYTKIKSLEQKANELMQHASPTGNKPEIS
jgi:hypothetical protein